MNAARKSEPARLAGVMGWPIAHSLSPRLHNYWFGQFNIDGYYVPLPVRPEDFRQALTTLPKMGFSGVNVTVPHKTAAFALVDETNEAARRMGAVNTVLIMESGWLVGLNTDGHGFLAHLKATVAGIDLGTMPVLLIGSGGAARAIAATLLRAGVPKLVLANRSRDRAERLALDLEGEGRGVIELAPLEGLQPHLAETALLVNSTSLGMEGQPPLLLPLQHLPQSAIVYDIVYKPLETPLLRQARGLGLRCVDGLGMLLHQAVPGFSHWGGVTPEVTDELKDLILEGL